MNLLDASTLWPRKGSEPHFRMKCLQNYDLGLGRIGFGIHKAGNLNLNHVGRSSAIHVDLPADTLLI